MRNETLIYVKMIDGVETLVPAKAEKETHEHYKINEISSYDSEDFSTVFEFLPGDTVITTYDPSRKIIIAQELFQSTNKDRELYFAIYEIVKCNGILSKSQKKSLYSAIKKLKSSNKIAQCKHPIVKEYLKRKEHF